MAVNLSRLPQVAQQFSQSMNANVMSQRVAQAAQDMVKIQDAAKVGKIDTSGLKNWVSQLQQAGVSAKAIGPILDNALKQAGVSKAMRIKIEADVGAALGPINSVKAALAGLHDSHHKVEYDVGQALAAAHSAALAGQSVPNITRYITYVVQQIGSVTGSPGGVPLTPAGIAAQAPALYTRLPAHAQTGGLVGGTGSGDIIPAMLEPGEAVVPRYLVPLVAPILAAHRVPGFGSPMGGAMHFAAGGVVPPAVQAEVQMAVQALMMALQHDSKRNPNQVFDWTLTGHGGQLPLPAYISKVLDRLLKDVSKSGIWKQFEMDLTGHFSSTLKNLAATTGNIARGLVGKITQEVGYAKGVSSAAMYGQGYDPSGKGSGIFGSMSTGPGSDTVYSQMQSYVSTVQSFGGDIKTLRKQHLNKDIIAQLIAAGPVQGDALAQSILQDYGGVKGVNQLWSQLGGASKALGAQAAMAQYGGYLNPSLTKGTFSYNNVTINLSSKGGTTLSLTPGQIKQLVEEIQAKLLQQARRNQKTGIQAPGKNA
jgi:hypothetical protein